ncbi:MAG: hypothetical protein ACRCSK_04700, partial [Fusobacteriaceae bacterium]
MKKKFLALIFFMLGTIIFAEDLAPKKLFNIYGKGYLDLVTGYSYNNVSIDSSSYNSLNISAPTFVSGKGVGYAFEIQGTYSLSDKVEFGLGVGYMAPSPPAEKGNPAYKYPSYTSIPLYLLGKYKFISEVKSPVVPYIQAESGLLFNTLQDEGYVVTDGLKVKEYSNIQLGYFGRFLIGAEVKGFVVDVG